MTFFKISLVAATLLVPHTALASDAFLTQVSAGPATITIDAQPAAQSADAVLAQLDLTPPQVSAPVDVPDLRAYPVPSVPAEGAFADVASLGDNNTATIMQTGLHAALIRQTGNLNTASILQSGQANTAAIYQNASNATAMIAQTGRNNSALIVQR